MAFVNDEHLYARRYWNESDQDQEADLQLITKALKWFYQNSPKSSESDLSNRLDEYDRSDAQNRFYAIGRIDRFAFTPTANPMLSKERINQLFTWFRNNFKIQDGWGDGFAEERGWPAQGMLSYFFDLDPPFIRQEVKVPGEVQYYYETVATEHIFGHYEASIAMARTTLEGIFKEKLGKNWMLVWKWEGRLIFYTKRKCLARKPGKTQVISTDRLIKFYTPWVKELMLSPEIPCNT